MTTDHAILAFAIVAVSLAAYAAVAWARRGPRDNLPTALLRLVLDVYMKVYHRLRHEPEPPAVPIPLAGPAIIVANHQSGVDPLALAACTKRKIHFMMAREYYEQRGMRWIFRLAEAIPVNRDGNDLGATKAAIKTLRDGEIIGIFPQGGIRSQGSELEEHGKAGVGFLALKTGAPVIPCYITGTPPIESVLRAMLKPSRTTVRFGEPLLLAAPEGRKPTREEMEAAAREIFGRIAALRAGQPAGELAERVSS